MRSFTFVEAAVGLLGHGPKLYGGAVQVMYRERAAGMYNELPFALAQCVIEIPYNLIQAILFSCIGAPPACVYGHNVLMLVLRTCWSLLPLLSAGLVG